VFKPLVECRIQHSEASGDGYAECDGWRLGITDFRPERRSRRKRGVIGHPLDADPCRRICTAQVSDSSSTEPERTQLQVVSINLPEVSDRGNPRRHAHTRTNRRGHSPNVFLLLARRALSALLRDEPGFKLLMTSVIGRLDQRCRGTLQ